MVAIGVVSSKFDLGRVVLRTFQLIGRNVVTFGLLAVVLLMIPLLAWAWGGLVLGQKFPAGLAISTSPWYWASALWQLVFTSALEAALIHGAMADLGGRHASVGDCLAAALRTCLPVFAIRLFALVAVLLASCLLVIPGVVLALTWFVAVPVAVIERTGLRAAFIRTTRLTDGNRGSLFGLSVAYSLLVVVLGMALRAVSAGLVGSNAWPGAAWIRVAITPLTSGATGILLYVGMTSIYYELRSIKEGVGPQTLASVFD